MNFVFRPGDRVKVRKGFGVLPEGARGTVTARTDKYLSLEWDVTDIADPDGWDQCRFEPINEGGSKRFFPDNPHEAKPDASEAVRTAETASESGSRGDALANGERMDEYGHPKVSFDRIAALWSAYLSAPEVDAEDLTGEDVGKMMILLKVSRSITDGKDDTLDDIEGYVSCIRMIREYQG